MGKRLQIKLVRSGIGKPQDQRETIKALGFKRLQQTVVHDDTPVIRGMVRKIQHLVEVNEV